MSFQTANIDEFGRDLSLKDRQVRDVALKNQQAASDFIAEITLTLLQDEEKEEIECDFMADFYKKFAGMSWAEITFAIEEEEEEEEYRKLQEKNKEDANRRRNLYAIGEYELEEGELFE